MSTHVIQARAFLFKRYRMELDLTRPLPAHARNPGDYR